jgi:hypothetical protein
VPASANVRVCSTAPSASLLNSWKAPLLNAEKMSLRGSFGSGAGKKFPVRTSV